ncbi:hypothetical protein CHLNCDRAFT_142095 [Chlorella variabilis]|uniref:NodB homology domain-containing protein n=1 Tax=Chlorella variabilis TaxID=554065 RepID=E1Z7R7_CHLVA|nr:hypothetical protein CHLNCDRAFT_142095 [Chlorella variabilis]EFN57965.1 hypothetical protein CHLNCDRAFT_142095 [Chlorella variabilis]|eukprot:XP_005850067.1 hypothetical protein CHLNCDRAFT_142095 [Chlorella variabilis]
MCGHVPRGLLFLALYTSLAIAAEPPSQPSAPNFILLSLDGGILPSTWEVAYDQTIIEFTCCCLHGDDTGDCGVVAQAYGLGHEMATHTMTHSEETLEYSYEQWAEEIGGQRDWLAGTCSIPEEEVVGFRAPNFQINNLMGRVLADLGFGYDSSLTGFEDSQSGWLNGTYDLDFCQDNAEERAKCSEWEELPLWEVPAYLAPGSFRRTDPAPVDGMSIVERLQADFERKRGTGIPVSINVHEPYLADSASREAVIEFLGWAFEQPGETWALTHQQYMEWKQAPAGTPVEAVVGKYPCDSS